MSADDGAAAQLLTRDEAQEITMDDELGVEPETPEFTFPMLTDAALPELLDSEDSVLANVLKKLVNANDEEQTFTAFGSAL